jgi:hypothetical protein
LSCIFAPASSCNAIVIYLVVKLYQPRGQHSAAL